MSNKPLRVREKGALLRRRPLPNRREPVPSCA